MDSCLGASLSFWDLDEPHHSQKRPSSSVDDKESLQEVWDPGSLLYTTWAQNQPGTSIGVVPNQANGSTAQASQASNTYNTSVFKRSLSCLSETDRARKRQIDQAYRERCKNLKVQMKLDFENLAGENESFKLENQSLKEDYDAMNQTLRDQTKEIDRLRSDLSQLRREHEKQNVLLQTLSGLIADPVQLENEKLKDENASLRKNINLNSNLPQLAEENAKLKIENKVLKVQNDALCGKIINDNDKKHEQVP